MGLLGIGGATPSKEPKKNTERSMEMNWKITSKNVSIWDSGKNGTGSVKVTNAYNKGQGYIDIIKDKANEFVDIKKEKDSIKEQYPYYSQDDVDARYEIEHMPFRSAELMEALHSGERPAKVLAGFNEKQNKIVNGTYQKHVDGMQDDVDGMTITEKYDEHNRIISRVTVFDTPENGKNTSEYHYNSDGSYTVISNEGDGSRYTYKYDNHGKLLSEQFNDETPEDFSKTKFEGDY